MPITVNCPGCKAAYQLADTMSGKKIRCKSCLAIFVAAGKPAPRRADDEAIRSSQRRAPVPVDDDDENWDEEPRRRRKQRKSNRGPMIALISAGAVVALLGVVGLTVWLASGSSKPPAPAVAKTPIPPPALPPTNLPPPIAPPTPPTEPNPATPAAAQNQGLPLPPAAPNPGNAAPNQGGDAVVQLTSAKVSGFGTRMQVSVEYRFTSGSAEGRNIFLLVQPAQRNPIRSNTYEAQLRNLGNSTQGTAKVGGVTFGMEHGPFEIWLEEGSPRASGSNESPPDRKKISNVMTVGNKEIAPPGPMGPRGGPRRGRP